MIIATIFKAGQTTNSKPYKHPIELRCSNMKFNTVLNLIQQYGPYVLTYRNNLGEEKLNKLLQYCKYIDIGNRKLNHKSTIRSIHSTSLPTITTKACRNITKIAVTIENESKLLRLVTKKYRLNRKIIIGMGAYGRITRLLYRKIGSKLMYSSPETVKGAVTNHIGLYSRDIMKYLYRSDKITNKTKVFALLGNPINHSIGPLIYNIFFSKHNIDAVYCRIYGTNPSTLIKLLTVFNVKGASITAPLKNRFKSYISSLDKHSATTGVVNTLLLRNRKLSGVNTDITAFITILKKVMPYYKNPKILILGSGSTCISATAATKELDIETFISARKAGRLNKIKSQFNITTVPMETLRKASKSFDIVLNTTPYIFSNTLVKSLQLNNKTTTIESVYFPFKTPLIAKSMAQGIRFIPGTELFMEQAYGQISHFLGSKHHENFRKTCRDVIKYYHRWLQSGKGYLGRRELEETLFWKLPRSLRSH